MGLLEKLWPAQQWPVAFLASLSSCLPLATLGLRYSIELWHLRFVSSSVFMKLGLRQGVNRGNQ